MMINNESVSFIVLFVNAAKPIKNSNEVTNKINLAIYKILKVLWQQNIIQIIKTTDIISIECLEKSILFISKVIIKIPPFNNSLYLYYNQSSISLFIYVKYFIENFNKKRSRFNPTSYSYFAPLLFLL